MTDTTGHHRTAADTQSDAADPEPETVAATPNRASAADDGGGLVAFLRGQAQRYSTVVNWFARDAYGRYRGRLVLIVVFSLLAIGGLMGAFGVIFFYVRALEEGTVIAYANYEIATRQSGVLLVAAAAGGLLLFIVSSVFRYAANLQALAIGRAYEGFCARRAIALIGAHGGRPEMQAWAGEAGRLIQSDPRFCGRVARITVNMILPVLTFAGTFTVLVVLDPVLTLVVIVLLAAALPFLYVINVRGAQHSMAMEKRAKAATNRKRELVALNAERGDPLDPESPEMVRPFRKGPIAGHLHAYVGRLRANHNSQLVTSILMGIGVVVILASKGSQILGTGQGWGELAVYMVALRVNLTSVTQASKTLTSVNRFYPQVARYFRFLQDVQGLPAGQPGQFAQVPAEFYVGDDDEE